MNIRLVRRLELALGARSRARGRTRACRAAGPKGLSQSQSARPASELASFAPKIVPRRLSRGRDRPADLVCCRAHHLAGRRRALRHAAVCVTKDVRAAQRRHVRAGLRRPHDRHALARAPRRRPTSARRRPSRSRVALGTDPAVTYAHARCRRHRRVHVCGFLRASPSSLRLAPPSASRCGDSEIVLEASSTRPRRGAKAFGDHTGYYSWRRYRSST